MKKLSIVSIIILLFSVSLFTEVNSSVGVGSEEIGRPTFAKKQFGYTDFLFTILPQKSKQHLILPLEQVEVASF